MTIDFVVQSKANDNINPMVGNSNCPSKNFERKKQNRTCCVSLFTISKYKLNFGRNLDLQILSTRLECEN